MSADLTSVVDAIREQQPLPHVVYADERWSPAFRLQHLTASQWPAACGYDPYQEPIELFGRLLGVLPYDDEESEASELGHALEPALLKLAGKRLGLNFVSGATFIHPRHPWGGATPDGLAIENAALCQVKTTGLANDGEPVEAEEWGPNEIDVPPRVIAQTTGELTIVRAWLRQHAPNVPPPTECHVALLTGGRARGFRLYRVLWDEDLARRLFDRTARFWAHVKTGTPPPPYETEAFYTYLEKRYPKHNEGKWVEADPNLASAISTWSTIDEQIAQLKQFRQAARNQICRSIGDAEGVRGGVGENAWRLPWRFVNGKSTLNADLIKGMLEQKFGVDEAKRIITACTTRGNGHRQLGPLWRPGKKKKKKASKA